MPEGIRGGFSVQWSKYVDPKSGFLVDALTERRARLGSGHIGLVALLSLVLTKVFSAEERLVGTHGTMVRRLFVLPAVDPTIEMNFEAATRSKGLSAWFAVIGVVR